ncbi:energy transducer TonB [Aeromonas rivipollensis]|uniref:energy transducer TonB n=1 Tax=Aeromonas rivipollensis TaxID=948519 RepID=UPI003D233FEA
MDACAMRPTHGRDQQGLGPVHLACLTVALVLHLALMWLMQGSRPAHVTPPDPITLSARWAGESNQHDAPGRPAAPALTPAPPKVVKPPTPVKQKQPKPVVKKPAPRPVPKAPPAPVAKPVAKAKPVTAPAAPAAQLTAANPLSPGSNSTPVKTSQSGTGGGSSAPIARDARLNNPEPPYPPESRRRGEEGRVVLKVRVSKEGTAESVEVERSSGHRRLDMVARKTVSRWRFIPARQNDNAIVAWAGVTIIFKLGA